MDLNCGFNLVDNVCVDAMHTLHLGISKATWDRIFNTKGAIPKAARRQELLLRWNELITTMKVPTEMRHKTRQIGAGGKGLKAADWQCLDTFVFTSLGRSLVGPEDLKLVLLAYSFLVRVLYSSEESFQEVLLRCNLENTTQTFLKAYSRLFGEETFTFNLHSFLHFVAYRKKHGPVWQYSTAMYEALYAKTRRCYRGNTPNSPKQLLTSFHASQDFMHHCKKQESMVFSQQASVKTDDTLVYHGGQFHKVISAQDNSITIQKLRTSALNTSAIIKLPWSSVGVRVYEGVTEEPLQEMDVNEIDAKAVMCGSIISSFHPQWVIT